ncbi:MAG: hypothetical protein M1337_02490 [Actinobacteria bacterium]|nr:hypothetical protein [Actinomycetota bacterium]
MSFDSQAQLEHSLWWPITHPEVGCSSFRIEVEGGAFKCMVSDGLRELKAR